MTTLTWLHLSDLHACHPKLTWDAGRVIETLVRDLRDLQTEHGLRPDLLFFTGDAAYGEVGSKPGETIREQFAHFGTFLDSVRTAFEPHIPTENVFLVPGNHDVNRGWVSDDQTRWLDLMLEESDDVGPVRNLIDKGNLQWRRYMERLKDYRDFLEQYGLEQHGLDHLLEDPERLIYATTRDVGGLRVGVAGFNSAWSCCRQGERGRLWMAGKWQQGVLRQKLAGADFSIALVHHPPDWLVEYETPDFGRGLEQDFRFLLHGHEHRAWVQSTAEGYTVVAAGACYESSESGNNGYNAVRLDLESGRGEVWLRGYEAGGGGWIGRQVFGKTDDRGVWPLSVPWNTQPRASSLSFPMAANDTAPAPTVPMVRTVDPELERYLQRLRAAHRDIPIAGFETRVRLPIHLDQVYIPLRARAVRTVLERECREYGALRELEAERLREKDVAVDASLRLAAEHGLRGAVVLGDPGSGKTTLLKHFVLASTDPMVGPATLGLPSDTVPVLVELRRLQDPAAGLRPAVESAVANIDLSLDDAARFSRKLFRRDRLLVLIDGLDEVADAKQRATVSHWLEEALHQLPESVFVVSSRYAGYKGDVRLSGKFLELHVRDVEEEAARLPLRLVRRRGSTGRARPRRRSGRGARRRGGGRPLGEDLPAGRSAYLESQRLGGQPVDAPDPVPGPPRP